MKCGGCRHENPDGARFCGACGAALDVMCPACRASNPALNKFCHQCGGLLAAPAPARRYTPGHLAQKILTSRAALEGERKQVAVLFADLKGSMELLADRDPEEARRVLDPVLERMMEAVHRYEGTVNQVMGDGIMALFGAPVAHEDHALRACLAALRMQRSVREYASGAAGQGPPIGIRVGLNAGEVVVRSIGSDLQMDYTAVGQTTHLAARMEQLAPPGSIFITGDVLGLATEYLRVRPLGPTAVKGLDAPVEVYELLGAAAARSHLSSAAAARGLTRFMGRVADLEALREALERVRRGPGALVEVTGEPGVGKSRLIAEFLRSGWTGDWLVLGATAVSYDHSAAYRPLVELLKRYFHVLDADPAGEIRDKVHAAVSGLDPALADIVPAILSLGEALPADDPFRLLDLAERRSRVVRALERLFVAESARQPLLMVVENAQWADPETLTVLERLVERLPESRLLLVIDSRPDGRHAWPGGPHTVIALEALPAADAERMLCQLLGDDAGLAPLRRLLIERTDGNPFFLEESVRTLIETRILVGEPGAYRLATPLAAVRVPATVQAVIASRVDRLPAAEKALLQMVSVIGKTAGFALIEAVAEMTEDALRAGLDHLQRAGFLSETSLFPDLEYSFKHSLTHEVAYASLLRDRRRALHGAILDAMETLYADRLAGQVDRLAYHASRAERWAKAVEYHRRAGERAIERAANLEAVTHFERAREALGHLPPGREATEQAIDLRLAARAPLLQLGRLTVALALSHEAERLAQELGDERTLARVYTYLINHHYLKGEPDLALQYGERCLAVGTACGDIALQATARQYMGQSLHAQGEYRRAEAILRENVAALEEVATGERLGALNVAYVASCGWLAFALAERGEFDAAQEFLERGERAAEAARHPYSQMIAWTLAGLVAVSRGFLAGALLPLERSLHASREKHLAVWAPIPSSLLGLTFARLGRPQEALELLRASVTRSEELGVRAYLALWMASWAEGLHIAGRADEAAAVAERALALAVAHRERGHEAWARRLLAQIAADAIPPKLESAITHYGAAIAAAEELGMRPLLAVCHLGLGELHRRAGSAAEAAAHRARAGALFRELGMRFWTRPECDLDKLAHLFVVARWNTDLHAFLSREFAGVPSVTVLADRRVAERRARVEPHTPERRRRDRRQNAAAAMDLRAAGVAIVQQSPPS